MTSTNSCLLMHAIKVRLAYHIGLIYTKYISKPWKTHLKPGNWKLAFQICSKNILTPQQVLSNGLKYGFGKQKSVWIVRLFE